MNQSLELNMLMTLIQQSLSKNRLPEWAQVSEEEMYQDALYWFQKQLWLQFKDGTAHISHLKHSVLFLGPSPMVVDL